MKPLKSIFNRAQRAAEDAYFGMMMPGMSDGQRLAANFMLFAGAAAAAGGIIVEAAPLVVAGTASMVTGSAVFSHAGMKMRR